MSEYTDEIRSRAESESNLERVELFDLSSIIPDGIAELIQEGNYLVGTTIKGTKFRHRIPSNKILTKINGQYSLQDMQIREIAQ